VVLDTNVLLSACLKPEGLEAQVVEMACSGKLQACVTAEILAEYEDVLLREKFRAFRERAESVLARIQTAALLVVAAETVTAASDEDDNRFLECAQAAGAEFLITGNLRHYPASWASTRIVNARAFTEAWRELRASDAAEPRTGWVSP
jgi:putative PIN family toxin of toxin-antitoxin system